LFVKRRLNLVHIHNMPNFLIFAAIIPRCFGKKIILDVHDTLIETYASKFNGIFSKLLNVALVLEEFVCCKLAHKVICVNETQRQALLNRGLSEQKTIVLMNLPDPNRYQLNRRDCEKRDNAGFRIVYFGTITRRLGVDIALRAIHEIRSRIPGLHFFIFGDGDGREECLGICIHLGMGDIVSFSETAVPLDELIHKVRGMDLLVVSNRANEATQLMLPVKMLEGMSMGIPVVAPRLRTIEHYFAVDQVFYFTPEDMHSLAGAILLAYKDGAERKNKAVNANRFFEKYSWDEQKTHLFALYSGMVGGGFICLEIRLVFDEMVLALLNFRNF